MTSNNLTFLSCDWGTSSFRLNWVNRENGAILATLKGPAGVKQTYWDYQKVKEDYPTTKKEGFFRKFLSAKIEQLSQQTGNSLNQLPIVVSGMASSSIGMRELPYGTLSMAANGVGVHGEWIHADEDLRHDLYLVSGLQTDTDVMRGEETQWLGLRQVVDIQEGVCMMPGTHSKHLVVRGGELVDFKTFMTGEMFHLIHTHSILKMPINSLSAKSWNATQKEAFRGGVGLGFRENMLHALFQVRTRGLLHQEAEEQLIYFLSGITIGYELSAWRDNVPKALWMVGGKSLVTFYQEAASALGWGDQTHVINPETTESLAILGQMWILQQMENNYP